jgi:hypothetical protein
MSLLRHGFQILFAAAIAAQLSAPVLAANAKALNLFCPVHASADRGSGGHDVHAQHGGIVSGAQAHAHSSVDPDETKHERNLFDPSCCSVHLTSVMPALSESFAVLRANLQQIPAGDLATVSPGLADPPPRISV